jgi:release factor glutamine methyltransferase
MPTTPLHSTLAAARTRLVDAGIAPQEAAVDVDLYARTILGWDRARMIVEQTAGTPDALEPRLSEWVARRSRREPSAYIVGTREFWGLDFAVSPAVLIPRPETEFIVEEALRRLDRTRPTRIADVGTGSGNIAVALAHEVPSCQVVATDVSADALAVARQNAGRHGVAGRVMFVCTSYLAGVEGHFDLITANPPYVREGDRRGLSPTVLHEPHVALFGGESGLRDIEGALDAAVEHLRPGGWFLMEFGLGQDDDVRARVAARPALRLERVIADLQGIPRTLVAERLAP